MAAFRFDDPWRVEEGVSALSSEIHEFWRNSIEEKCRGTLIVTGLLRFEDIIEVDSDGDSAFPHPHIYVSFSKNQPPFSGILACLTVLAIFRNDKSDYEQIAEPRKSYLPDSMENRVYVFPKKFRKAASK